MSFFFIYLFQSSAPMAILGTTASPLLKSLRSRLSPRVYFFFFFFLFFSSPIPPQRRAVLSLTPLADLTINAIIRVCVTLSHLNLGALTGKRRPVVFVSRHASCMYTPAHSRTTSLTHAHTHSGRQAERGDSDARKC